MANRRDFKDQLYDQFERIGKALASRRRLELLDVLAQGERSVEDLAVETSMSVANASQHLQVLRRSNLVDARAAKNHVYYSLADESVYELLRAIRNVAREKLAEVDRIVSTYLEHPDGLEPIRMGELSERLKSGDVVVLDVRPTEEYKSGHISGARSVPLDELESRLNDLPANAEVVAYCRGPYCVLAVEAIEKLRRSGRSARRLDVGFPDWKAAGLPFEQGA